MNESKPHLIQKDAVTSMPKRTNRIGNLWAYILIGFGLLFLLENFGVPTWGVWNALAQGWPLLLIVLGASLLTRNYLWGRSLTFGLSVLALLSLGIWLINQNRFSYGDSQSMSGELSLQSINYPIGAARAEIQLSTSVGRLVISPIGSENLLEGKIQLSRNDRLEREAGLREGVQFLRLEAKMNGSNWMPNPFGSLDSSWIVGLSSKIPLRLNINTGVGSSDLDLSQLKVTNLNIGSGVGQMNVTLPALGKVTASVKGGVGELNIFIPSGMEAKVRASSGLGTVSVRSNYRREGDTYTSAGFEGAVNRVELEVKGGVGRVSVQASQR